MRDIAVLLHFDFLVSPIGEYSTRRTEAADAVAEMFDLFDGSAVRKIVANARKQYSKSSMTILFQGETRMSRIEGRTFLLLHSPYSIQRFDNGNVRSIEGHGFAVNWRDSQAFYGHITTEGQR